jgi:hypothetical protein
MSQCVIAAVLCALSFAAVPADPRLTTESAPANPCFKRADTNRDGFLSREEWRRVNGAERVFDESDDNHDARLDSGEYLKASSRMQRQRAAGVIDALLMQVRT